MAEWGSFSMALDGPRKLLLAAFEPRTDLSQPPSKVRVLGQVAVFEHVKRVCNVMGNTWHHIARVTKLGANALNGGSTGTFETFFPPRPLFYPQIGAVRRFWGSIL